MLGLDLVGAELEGGVEGADGAVDARRARTTHEILIGEVEIISMLISSSPSVENTLAATPGWRLHSGAHDRHLPHLGVLGDGADAVLGDDAVERRAGVAEIAARDA